VCLRAGANSCVWTLQGASSQTWRWVQPFRTVNTCLESTASVLLNLSSQSEVRAYLLSCCPSFLVSIPPFVKDTHTHTPSRAHTHSSTTTHRQTHRQTHTHTRTHARTHTHTHDYIGTACARLQEAQQELEISLQAKAAECATIAANADALKTSVEELSSGKRGADSHITEMQATLQKLDAEVHDLLEQLSLVDESLTRYLSICARVHTRSLACVRARTHTHTVFSANNQC
jgi:hypothetical protein